jgi:hypothetical protein
LSTLIWPELDFDFLVLKSGMHAASSHEGVVDAVERDIGVAILEEKVNNFQVVDVLEVIADAAVGHVVSGEADDQVASMTFHVNTASCGLFDPGLATVPVQGDLMRVSTDIGKLRK